LGTVCGIAALLFLLKKRPALMLVIAILSIPVAYYLVHRLSSLNSVMLDALGSHPKIYAHLLVCELLSQNNASLLGGTGLGQFTSTPQIWSSDAFRSMSVQSAPDLVGLHISEFHRNYIEPVSSAITIYPQALSSAANKPYTGFTTLIAEMGLSSVFLLYLFFKRVISICAVNTSSISFFAFFISLNLVDQWVDNLFLGYCLMLVCGFFENNRGKAAALAPDP
jgi:hypothetical protein